MEKRRSTKKSGWMEREIATKGKGSVGKESSTIQQNKRGPLLPNQRLPGTLDPEKDYVCATPPPLASGPKNSQKKDKFIFSKTPSVIS